MALAPAVRALLNAEQPLNPYIEFITGSYPNLGYIGFIAGGSEGRVYLIEALDQPFNSPDRFFARKVCQEQGVPEKEVRNISVLASLPPHPNVMRVFRHGLLTSFHKPLPNNILPFYYFDMDLGRLSLEKYIRTHFHANPQIIPSPAELWNILSQLASAIEYLHRNRLVHRDIKPDNFITSWSNPNLWKLTDFGISVISSGYLMSTRIGQGSDQYMAPEILSRNKYGSPVDIWGVGCILYEIFAGHRLFNDRSEIADYRIGKTPLKQFYYPSSAVKATPVSLLYPQDKPIRFSFQVLSNAKCEWVEHARKHLGHFCEAFRSMTETKQEVTGKVCGNVAERLGEINALLKWMLNYDPAKRPTAKAVLHHFRGLYLRSMLENDEAFRIGVVESLINPTRKIGIPYTDIIDRWQFFIKLEAICAENNRLQLYRELNILANRFLTRNCDDPILNGELMRLLSQNPELFKDFKRIYVYGVTVSETTLGSQPPTLSLPALSPPAPYPQPIPPGVLPMQTNLDDLNFGMGHLTLNGTTPEQTARGPGALI